VVVLYFTWNRAVVPVPRIGLANQTSPSSSTRTTKGRVGGICPRQWQAIVKVPFPLSDRIRVASPAYGKAATSVQVNHSVKRLLRGRSAVKTTIHYVMEVVGFQQNLSICRKRRLCRCRIIRKSFTSGEIHRVHHSGHLLNPAPKLEDRIIEASSRR